LTHPTPIVKLTVGNIEYPHIC